MKAVIVCLLLCALSTAQATNEITACVYQVYCDDWLPEAGGLDGIFHKWGDYYPQCWDPSFKGPITILDVASACSNKKKEKKEKKHANHRSRSSNSRSNSHDGR